MQFYVASRCEREPNSIHQNLLQSNRSVKKMDTFMEMINLNYATGKE